MSTYLERAEAEWDRMSLSERIKALDTGDNDLLGFVEWWNVKRESGWNVKRESWRGFDSRETFALSIDEALADYLRNHQRFAAWLDREAQRQQALEQEPDDWNDDLN